MPRVMGARPLPSFSACSLAVVCGEVCTTSETLVAPLSAARVFGEKVAVAPSGRPEMVKVIAAGKVAPLTGLTDRA